MGKENKNTKNNNKRNMSQRLLSAESQQRSYNSTVSKFEESITALYA